MAEQRSLTLLKALVVGANQRTSTLDFRDRLAIDEARQGVFLARLREAGVGQVMLLQTCDRIEVMAVHAEPQQAASEIIRTLAFTAGLETGEVAQALGVRHGAEAVRHIFAVSASLESTVIGEPHVLGQIKDSHRLAAIAGTMGSALDGLMQRAFAAAKRVRRETAIGERPVSIAAAAVDLARGVHGDLDRVAALMLGTGELGGLIIESLRAHGLSRLKIVDTRLARAEGAARALDCHAGRLEELPEHLAGADVVLGNLGQRTPTITVSLIKAALRRRRNRPIVLFDASVPGDCDPGIDALDNAFFYTLDDLERVAREGRKAREGEKEAAWRIVEEEAAAFLRDRAERAAVPIMSLLRRHAERLRRTALADAGGDADKATRLLVNRLVHDPIVTLRMAASRGDEGIAELAELEAVLVRLFHLDAESAEEPDDAG